ncbi:unnamed protein product [Coregonus sp. 'balchen']|nr:unnamed protein product [Coregonus sp. 'balchen']
MASVDLRDNNLLGISWVDSGWVPILNPGNVLDYFSERSNPFYDRTCNNEVVKMQRLTLEHLKWLEWSTFSFMPRSPSSTSLGNNRDSLLLRLSAVHGVQSAFDEAMSYCRYHPSKGYWWHFKDQEERVEVKKESEPPAETVKQEEREREPATKTSAPAPPSSKPPPEKRARLQ